jgi:hypothetical protein
MKKSRLLGAVCSCLLPLCFQSALAGINGPIADADGPYVITAGDDLTLDASGSIAPFGDFDDLMFRWDVNDDGDFLDASGVMPTLSWSELVSLGLSAPYFGDVTVEVTYIGDFLNGEVLSTNDITIDPDFDTTSLTINPIPIPAAIWLFGSGLIGLVGIARRKRTT